MTAERLAVVDLSSAQVYNGSGTSQSRITSWAYDGTMPVAETYRLANAVTKTRWAVGPRGTERQEVVTATTTDVGYPLYDGHGNQTAMLRRDSNNPGGYLVADGRVYDPWGNVRSGDSANPVQGYCGSLGHRQDDDLGFVYMRARYYDPACGRFTSQDRAMDGYNWFAYCGNDPVNKADSSGNATDWVKYIGGYALYALGNISCWVGAVMASAATTPQQMIAATAMCLQGIGDIAFGLDTISSGTGRQASGDATFIKNALARALGGSYLALLIRNVAAMVSGGAVVGKSLASNAGIGLLSYQMVCLGYLTAIDLDTVDY